MSRLLPSSRRFFSWFLASVFEREHTGFFNAIRPRILA